MIKDDKTLEKNDGPWYYEMHYLGFNYRITDLQCALGISQLKKLDRFIEKRQEIARYYDEAFGKDEHFIIPKVSDQVYHAYHLYPLQISFDRARVTRKAFFQHLRAKNIFCQVHYIPVHLHPFYRERFGTGPGLCPAAEEAYERIISLPIFPRMSEKDVNDVIKAVFKVCEAYRKE